MAKTLDVTGQTVGEARKNRFAALPAGSYNVEIFDVTEGEYGPKSANAGRENYNVQLRIADGQTGANRRQFETIPLFFTWAPTAKNPDGSDAFSFFQFFAAVQGKTEKAYRAEVKEAVKDGKFSIPDPVELMGKSLVVTLKIENDTYAYAKYLREVESGDVELAEGEAPETQADFTRNTVSGWKPAGSKTGSASGGTSTTKADDLITL